nr:UDP-N-acetylmuramoyl-tripeptide--D-alanyl-D-alanine ligase [Bacteroidales bacterium]
MELENPSIITDLYKRFLTAGKVSTDTRSIEGGELFFALKGANFDGNRFVHAALEKGCSYVVADDPSFKDIPKVLLVKDSLKVLQELANYHRSNLGVKVLAITGSNGKTTTKELVSAVLKKKYRLLSTRGNLNNHIGVPLTILGIKDEELAVIEMGANHPGEIRLLCEIADPDVGLITNIGKAHLDGFGGIEGVEKAKGELYDFLAMKGGDVLLNGSEPRLINMASERSLHYYLYGLNPEFDLYGKLSNSISRIEGEFFIGESSYKIESSLFGKYNFMNILGAAAAGAYFGVDSQDISDAINDYNPDNNRSQVSKGKTNTLIMDAYNANPTSMISALEEFDRADAEKKMLILGDMYELGDSTETEHEKILNWLAQSNIKDILLVGDYFAQFSNDQRFPFNYFSDIDECIGHIAEQSPSGYLILLKGSRKNSLEKATKLLLD